MVSGLPSSFTTATAVRRGVPVSTLYRMRDRGDVVALGRGVWRRADAEPTLHESLLAVTLLVPHGTVCLLSALAFHDLTDEIPTAVDLAVARGRNQPHINYPPVHVHVFDAETFELGREHVEVAPGETVPIYSPVRSVVDAVRLRHQLGTEIAYGAMRRLLERRRGAAGELAAMSTALNCAGPVGELLEVLQA